LRYDRLKYSSCRADKIQKQTLFATVQSVANQFPDSSKGRYQQAAAKFRIPYWDWAAQRDRDSEDYFPDSISSPKINVVTPQSNGQVVQIDNPLYSYKFNPLNPVSGDFTDAPVSLLLSIKI
jgi:tyrosinase